MLENSDERIEPGETVFKVHVHTGSSKRKLEIRDKILHVYTNKRPVKGEANKDVIVQVSKHFKVPRTSIKITRGEKSSKKLIKIKRPFGKSEKDHR